MIVVVIILLLVIFLIVKFAKKENLSAKPTLVFFNMITCPHCKAFKPTWEMLQKHNKKVNYKIIPAEKSREYGVKSFPTVMLFKGSVSPGSGIKYNDTRTVSKLNSFINANV